jgi:hypothetical protein
MEELNPYEVFANRMEEKYPKIFAEPYGGFACGEGWWPILESLSGQIQHHIDWKQEQKEKYARGEGCAQVTVNQIKEKFGGLRFYYSGGDDVIDGMVRMAESWAGHSCETCGAPGKIVGGGWLRTLCVEHAKQRGAE